MAALEIARVNVLRVIRDRTNLFFVVALPLVIIATLGVAFGGAGASRIGIVRAGAGPLGDELVASIEAGDVPVEIRERASLEELRSGVERGELDIGVLIPAGYDEALLAGDEAALVVVSREGGLVPAARRGVETAVARQSALVRAARLAVDHAGVQIEEALEQARELQSSQGDIEITATVIGEASFPVGDNPFALGAQSQTILFMFLTSMTAATQLILTRQLGVSRRMLATPTPLRSILLGELGGRFGIAMLQGVFIVVVSTLFLGVGWGDLAGASAVIVLFALVGTGAAMTIGAFVGNVDQASALGVVLGMILGALGGAMVPLELFDEPMSTLARLTPHAWAISALRDLVFDGATVAGILGQLGVLVAYAAGLVILGIWGLRRSLTRA